MIVVSMSKIRIGFAQTWKSPWIWPWSWKTPGVWKKCLLSIFFLNHPWKYELVFEKYKIQLVLSDLWDAQKNFVWKSQKKTSLKSLHTHHRSRCDLCSILFNLCGSPRFYGVRINEIECAFSFRHFRLKKCIFSCCFIQNWEEIESLKN